MIAIVSMLLLHELITYNNETTEKGQLGDTL